LFAVFHLIKYNIERNVLCMKKFIFIVAAVLTVSAIVSGCAKTSNDTPTPLPRVSAAPEVTPVTPAVDETAPVETAPAETPAPSAAVEKGTPEKSTFDVGTLNSTAYLLVFIAVEEGFLAEEGLKATATPFASAGELVAGLEGGQLDAAFIGSVPTITNQASGHDITIFGGAMTNGHGYVIKTNLVPDGFKEGDITVLKGKNIASV
jgi:NitT/TauT family transport system substrate-binding protein